MFAVANTYIRAGVGCDVTVFGGVFNALCRVRIGAFVYPALDVDGYSFVFAAPKEAGTYSCVITDGTTSSEEITVEVVAIEEIDVWKLPERGEDEFVHLLLGLLPRGFAWNVIPGTNFYKLFSACAVALLWVYNLLANLVKELSPATTTSYSLWENELALPRKGLEQSTNEGRLKEIYRIACQRGGCTVPHYRQLLDLYGATYEIYEYWKNPEAFPSWVSELGERANYCVFVKVFLVDYTDDRADCESSCEASLGGVGDTILEQLLLSDKQSHVRFIFGYEEAYTLLADDDGNVLTDEEGTPLSEG